MDPRIVDALAHLELAAGNLRSETAFELGVQGLQDLGCQLDEYAGKFPSENESQEQVRAL